MTDVRDLEVVQAAGYTLISGGAAYNLTLEFYPDYMEVINYTKSATVSEIVRSTWMRGFPAGDAVSIQSIADNGSTANLNSVLETTNGFTWAGVASGYSTTQKTITGATQASPVVITSASHGLSNGDRVRITDVVGMTSLNNNEYVVALSTTNTFALTDAQGNDIDGTGFTAYSSGGEVNDLGPTNDVENTEETFIMTLGSGVMGNDSDVLYVKALKFPGGITNLGDVGA